MQVYFIMYHIQQYPKVITGVNKKFSKQYIATYKN